MRAGTASAVREAFAEAILGCSQTGNQSELIALAWTLRNRAEQMCSKTQDETGLDAITARQLAQSLLADVGIEAQRSANGNGRARYTENSIAFDQALACVSLVLDGLLPDPTDGASRVHPHDQAPPWAKDFEATALIGPLMFLRERPETAQTSSQVKSQS